MNILKLLILFGVLTIVAPSFADSHPRTNCLGKICVGSTATDGKVAGAVTGVFPDEGKAWFLPSYSNQGSKVDATTLFVKAQCGNLKEGQEVRLKEEEPKTIEGILNTCFDGNYFEVTTSKEFHSKIVHSEDF